MESQAPPKSQPLTCTEDHQFLPLNKICVRPSCYSYCLMCDKCLKTYHSGPTHEVLTIDEYKEKFLSTLSQNSKNVDQIYVEGIKTTRKRLLQRLSIMQNSMASLIKKIRLAINNQFQTIIQSFNPDTYPNGLASWQQELTAKKIITTCYKIIVIRRNQFNGKLQNVLFSELQYNNKFQIATQKFKQIISEFQELKYVNENTIIKPIPIPTPEQREKINQANLIDSQKPISSISLNKKKKKKIQKELIEISSSQSDRDRSRGKKKNAQQINQFEPIPSPKKEIAQQKQNFTQNANKSKTDTVIPFTFQNIPWKKMSQSQVSEPKVPEIGQKSKIPVPENKMKQKIFTFPQKQEISQKQVTNKKKQSEKLGKNDQSIKKKGEEDIKVSTKILKINPGHTQDRQNNEMNRSLIVMNSNNTNQNHSSTSYSLSAMKIRQQQGLSKKTDKTPEKPLQKIIQKKKEDVKHVPRPTQHTQPKVPQKESLVKQPIIQKKDIKTSQIPKKDKQIKQKPKDPRNRTITSGTITKAKQPEKPKIPQQQIVYHENYILYCGIRRPVKHPTTMKDEQIKDWFHGNYPTGNIYPLILSHKSIDGGKSYEYLFYYRGDFRWVTQQYLKDTDSIPILRDYWAANKIYQNRPNNQVQ